MVLCLPPERDLIVAPSFSSNWAEAHRRRLVVPGDPPPMWGHDAVGHGDPPLVAPQRWMDATRPCPQPLCHRGVIVHPDSTDEPIGMGPCPDCIDGRKREALRAPCASPYCDGGGWDKDQPGWRCPNFCTRGSVRFAYATVEVLPVLTYNSAEWATHVMVDLPADYVDECTDNRFVPEHARGVFVRRHKIDGNGKVYWSEELFGVEPLPVPGRDWVVLLDNVELV